MPVRAGRTGRRPGEQRIRGVLDQQEAALVAPAAPGRAVLRKPEVVDEHEGTDARAKECVHLGAGGKKARVLEGFQSREAQRVDAPRVERRGNEDDIAGNQPGRAGGRGKRGSRIGYEEVRALQWKR